MNRPLGVLLAVALVLSGSCVLGNGETVQLVCTSPPENAEMSNYWAGASFEGLKLSTVMTRCDRPQDGEATGPHFVSYLYGDCDPEGEGCAPPIEVQNWPPAERGTIDLPGEDTTVLGVPATRYEGGARLEIHHPDVTVVIFADNAGMVDRFAAALAEGPSGSAELAANGFAFG